MAVESAAPQVAAPTQPAARRGGLGRRLKRSLRALGNVLVTLAVLAVLGGVADVLLHRVTHVSRSGSTYAHIYEIDIVLDGDGAVSVTGVPNGSHAVTLAEADTSTMFDHPQRINDVVAGTLYLTARCPDSLCNANLTVTAAPDVTVKVRMGNALHLNRATLAITGLSGQVDLVAWPAQVVVKDSTSTVTGVVSGPISCTSTAFCEVAMPR